MKTVKILTFGCKTNFYESSAMAGLLSGAGYEITEADIADIYIINSCTVTNTGASKSRQAIAKCKRLNPSSMVALTGCLAQVDAEEIAKIDGVDIVSGVSRLNIVELLDGVTPQNNIPTEYEEISAVDTQSRVRAVIKIQDGCDNYCSYCIIPFARGKARSRKLKNILAEARELAKNYTEIVITGINLSNYGKDLQDDISLLDVIEQLNAIDGIERIRLGSLSPVIINEEFVSRAKKLDKLCPQFHLSLQSGCNETLKSMNRKYDTAQYYQAVRILRENIVDCAITTDLIVGFPGETDEQFEQSFEFCKQIGFSQMHIFKYSKRSGTVAAEMEGQIPKAVKQQRSEKMLDLALSMKREFYQNYIGRVVNVLFESRRAPEKRGRTPKLFEKEEQPLVRRSFSDDVCAETSNEGELGRWFGLTPNYIDVLVKSSDNFEGKIKCVKVTGVEYEYLVGEIID